MPKSCRSYAEHGVGHGVHGVHLVLLSCPPTPALRKHNNVCFILFYDIAHFYSSVTTTTTTTTTYQPIPLPPLPPPVLPDDPNHYPLLHAQLPPSLRSFPLVFPSGHRATFRDGDAHGSQMHEDIDLAAGSGWRMLKREDISDNSPLIGLSEAVERFGRKRSLADDPSVDSARKKPRSTPNAAAPPSPLPSPHGSPPPDQIGRAHV